MPILLVPGDYPQSDPSKAQEENKPGRITEGGVRETTLGELLPDSFGPEELKLPRVQLWWMTVLTVTHVMHFSIFLTPCINILYYQLDNTTWNCWIQMSTQAPHLSSGDRKKPIQGAVEGEKYDMLPSVWGGPDLVGLYSVKATAYSPYSKFHVGACLLAADGTLTKGVSIDNIS